MGQGAVIGPPGYRDWQRVNGGGTYQQFTAWLAQNGYANGSDYARAVRAQQEGGGTVVPGPNGPVFTGPGGVPVPTPGMSNIPVPGQTPGQPTPIAPPPSIPSPQGQPAFAPPQVQMPQLLANPTPQGLGGMPLVRDRMMGATMSPFAGPNWGVPQVNPAYLTQTVRLPQGATPADVMSNSSAVPVGIAPPTQIPGQGFGMNGTTPSGWAAGPRLGSVIGTFGQPIDKRTPRVGYGVAST